MDINARVGGSMKTYYEKNNMMVSRKIANEFILVPIKDNVGDIEYMFTLNSVGGRIWELLNGHTTIEQVVNVLTEEYEVNAQQAEADTLEFLSQMEEIGAVVKKVKEN
jgi:diacylglycerol kinase